MKTTARPVASFGLAALFITLAFSPVLAQEAQTIIFSEGWESGIGAWYVTNGVWQVGVPISGPGEAHSGTRVAATNLSGNYPPWASTTLVSPRFTLPQISSDEEIWLSYWQWFAIHEGDAGSVYVSTDNGINWTRVSDPPYASWWINKWSPTGLDLSTYAGLNIRLGFSFSSDGYYEWSGWYLDDILVSAREKPYWPVGTVETFEGGYGDWYVDRGVWEIGEYSGSHSGLKCAGTPLNGTYPNNSWTHLISPRIEVPSITSDQEIWLSYWQWFALQEGDRGSVQVSTDNGATWTTVSDPPYASWWINTWSPTGLDLSAYAGTTIRLGFYLTSDNYYDWSGWYIDDVLISARQKPYWPVGIVETFEGGYGDWYVDRGVWEIGDYSDAHSGQKCAGTYFAGNYPNNSWTHLISPRIELPTLTTGKEIWLSYWQWFAIQEGDGGSVQVSTDDGHTWTTVSEPPYASWRTDTWSPTGLDLSAYAGSTIRLGFYFSSDNYYDWVGWRIDDVLVSLRVKPFWTYGMVESFEDGYGSWYVDHGVWEIGDYVNSHTGQKCAGTHLEGSYPDYTSSVLISPRFVCGEFAEMFFWHAMSIAEGDHGQVLVSTDQGRSWNIAGVGVYQGYSGWTQAHVDLSSYAGQAIQLGFYFRSDGYYQDSGWYVDDITLLDVIAVDPTSSLPDTEDTPPTEVRLLLSNPYYPRSPIHLELPAPADVDVSVYNVLGQQVQNLYSGPMGPGRREISWDGRTRTDSEAGNGVYFLRASVGKRAISRSIVLMR